MASGRSAQYLPDRAPVPFRKSYRGLAALVELELGHNVFAGNLYAFTNRRRDKIKCLLWEDNGFVLYYKALSEEKFHWPTTDEEVVTLSCQEINWLLDGAPQAHKDITMDG